MPGQVPKTRARRRKSDERFIVLRLSRDTDSDLADWWANLPAGTNGSALIKEAIRAYLVGDQEPTHQVGQQPDVAALRSMIEALGSQIADLSQQLARLSVPATTGARPSSNGSRPLDRTPELDPDLADERRRQILGRKW